ncbi:hypothetical protein F2Q70_00021026 [Brassica cretica]|uniref:Uncharacterized protein n=2 Tax=Brassica cretica TaxID=69181 RepID=A0A3N6S2Q6_BRACR|nr:hypothetical protein F2Q70_00021026 [Brassica cretica]KAF2557509.1 hypothetical protein F2Q68_00014504 [Brassica cretica]KAF3611307.1 hypothetical protein DY000_02047006 [Brassica cretica]
MVRDLQGMQRCLQEKEDPRYLKGRQTHIKSKLDLRRWNQRSSISQGLKVFQRSQGMQVIFTKDDQRILQLHRQRKMRRRNQVGQVITTGCNPKEEMGLQGIGLHFSGRVRLVLHKQAHLKLRGILRQCPHESPLANGQILIDGQVLIRLMADSMTNWRVQVVDGDAHVSVFGDILIQEGQLVSRAKNSLIRWWSKDICVDSLPNHVVLGGVSCLSVHRYKVMLKCSLFKNIKVKSKTVPEIWSMSDFKVCGWFYRVQCDIKVLLQHEGFTRIVSKVCSARLNAREWNRKAKEEINLQKDVQVSVQALEQVRDFDSKLGSQLKTLDEGFKKIMKRLQALLKVELREVRRDKRKQGDAEDEQACSSIKKGRHKGRVMDLDQIVDVVDPGSTPDVARCGRELGEQFFSHKQG